MRSDDLMYCVEEDGFLTATPMDFKLLAQARAAKGHVSDKAVMDEYNRLLLAVRYRARKRSLWLRRFERPHV